MPRAAVIQLFHEANAFTPVWANYEGFLSAQYFRGEDVRREFGSTSNWLGGVTEALDEAGYDVQYGICTGCLPGGTLETESYHRLVSEIIQSLKDIVAAGPVDIVALLLHGALVVDGVATPETDLARKVRAIVGPNVRIAVPLDFHANVEPLLPHVVDVIIGGKLYPHADTHARGKKLMQLALDPVSWKTRRFRLPVAAPMSAQTSDAEPFKGLVVLSDEIEQRTGLADVVVMGGFPYVDSDEVGSSVLITGTSDEAMKQAYRDMAEVIWENREAITKPAPSFEESATEIYARATKGRVVIGDAGDNPGSGGVANVADIFASLSAQDLPFAAGFMVDGDAVLTAQAIGEGNRGTVAMGRLQNGEPFVVDAFIERVTEVRYRNEGANLHGELLEGGLGAVLRIGEHGHIVLVTERIQAYDTQAFRSLGINLESKAIIHVKSSNHFRTSFTPLAEQGVFVVDSGGFASTDATKFPFTKRATRILPLAPLDKSEWDRQVAEECEIAFQSL
ncbi:M81 family metallopeptidase [Brucella pseudogrignonensis]|uniref:Microcystin degradation protein MlrC n=1 Tax=Brucella pseudogrignonensis TaxID=419475 RepID=A0ABU1MFI1_9HYPH|nr:M81 family metallopeptidase [Brucella pseudogrignonensis]MDR6434506.1 microcystin degradation protein MlrC [Brucella pseudogrignonensis]